MGDGIFSGLRGGGTPKTQQVQRSKYGRKAVTGTRTNEFVQPPGEFGGRSGGIVASSGYRPNVMNRVDQNVVTASSGRPAPQFSSKPEPATGAGPLTGDTSKLVDATNLAGALKRADVLANNFRLLQMLDESGLSSDPLYQQEVEKYRATAQTQIDEINNQIAASLAGQQMFQNQSDFGRSLVESSLASFNPAETNVHADLTDLQKSVQTNIATALVPEVDAKDIGGGYGKTEGGVQSMAGAEADRKKRNEGIREIEAIIAGDLSNAKALSDNVMAAANKVAASQANLIGINDARARAKAKMSMANSIRSNISDLVAQRSSIIKERDNTLTALEQDAAASRFGKTALDVSYSPSLFASETVDNFLESHWKSVGVAPTSAEQDYLDNVLASLFGLDANGNQNAPRVLPEDLQSVLAAHPDLRTLMTANPEKGAVYMKALEKAYYAYNLAYDKSSNWDFSKEKKVEPGSARMGLLINKSLEQGVAPYDIEKVHKYANSAAFHQIIAMASGGNVAPKRYGGDLWGLGAMPSYVYDAYGYDAKSATPEQQMEVLIGYIETGFGGDPAAALAYFNERNAVELPEEVKANPEGVAKQADPAFKFDPQLINSGVQ